MSQRTIPWGTILAGAIALGTAVLIALIEVAGLTITLRGAGPRAVIVAGLLILVVGLVVVLRAGRAARRESGEAAAPAPRAGSQQPQDRAPAAPAPTPSSPLAVTEPVPTPTQVTPDISPVATGPDGEPAQSSH